MSKELQSLLRRAVAAIMAPQTLTAEERHELARQLDTMAEQADDELMQVIYFCPSCATRWVEYWCKPLPDATCPVCSQRHVTPYESLPIERDDEGASQD